MVSHPFTVGDLLATLDEIAPFALAESWDNVGLLAGSPEEPVGSILVALDPTEEVLVEAVAADCNVIVTHHPPIFKALKSIRTDLPEGRLLAAALAAKVTLIGCHTNLDLAGGGVNDVLARRLGLEEIRPLAGSGPDTPGFGRIGTLPTPVDGEEMLARVARELSVTTLSFAGPLPATVRRVAVCGGSGSELTEEARRQGADLFLTAEVKHSTARWAEACGFCVVDGGHFATENVVVREFADRLRQTLARQDRKVGVRATVDQRSPFRFYTVK